jgi:hypothetical protein
MNTNPYCTIPDEEILVTDEVAVAMEDSERSEAVWNLLTSKIHRSVEKSESAVVAAVQQAGRTWMLLRGGTPLADTNVALGGDLRAGTIRAPGEATVDASHHAYGHQQRRLRRYARMLDAAGAGAVDLIWRQRVDGWTGLIIEGSNASGRVRERAKVDGACLEPLVSDEKLLAHFGDEIRAIAALARALLAKPNLSVEMAADVIWWATQRAEIAHLDAIALEVWEMGPQVLKDRLRRKGGRSSTAPRARRMH